DLAVFCHGLNDSYVAAASSEEVPRAVLLSVAAAAEEVAEVAALAGGELYLAIDNCPHQVVLVGAADDVARARAIAAERGLVCETLPYDRAVHTPQFEPIARDLRAIFARLPVKAPSVQLWSCTSAGPHSDDPTQIRELLVEHWTSTVRFRETIERMHDDGFRIFIESGARGNLTAFVEDVLRGREACAVAADVRRRSGTAQLCHLVAQLAVHCVELNPGYLFEHRGVAAADWRAPAPSAVRKGGPKMPLTIGWPWFELSQDALKALRAAEPAVAARAPPASPNGSGSAPLPANGSAPAHEPSPPLPRPI